MATGEGRKMGAMAVGSHIPLAMGVGACVFLPAKMFLWVLMSSEVKWGFLMVLNTMPTFFLLHFAIWQGF